MAMPGDQEIDVAASKVMSLEFSANTHYLPYCAFKGGKWHETSVTGMPNCEICSFLFEVLPLQDDEVHNCYIKRR